MCFQSSLNETSWKQLPKVHIGAGIRHLLWGGSSHVLAVTTIRQLFFLFEQERAVSFHNGVSAVQVSPNELAINFYNAAEAPTKLSSNFTIERIILTEGNIIVFGSGRLALDIFEGLF